MIVIFRLLILTFLLSFQIRSKHEIFTCLPLIIDDANGNTNDPTRIKPCVNSCIANFMKEEDCEYKCDSTTLCDGMIATSTKKIIKKPRTMLIHLVRINNEQTSEVVNMEKNNNQFELTPRVTFTMPVTTSHPTKHNEIRSIIHHMGETRNSGHYTTDGWRNHQWMSFDDETIVDKNFVEIIGCSHNQRTAYIMMYKELASLQHVVSTSNNQTQHGVPNITKIAPTSVEHKTPEQIQKQLQETRRVQQSDHNTLPCE